MIVASVNDKNSSSSSQSFVDCNEEIHVGNVLARIAMSLCFFLGTPAHSWHLWLFLRGGWKIKPTQIFHLILVGVELTYCIPLPALVLNGLLFNSSEVLFATYFFYGLPWFYRPLLQTCMCIERYLAVIHPVIFLRYKGMQYRIAPAVATWLMALGYGMCLAFSVLSFPDPLFVFVFFTGMILMSFCCVSVLCALKKPGPGDGHITMTQQKRNAFKIIFGGLITVLFGYLPLTATSIFRVVKIDAKLFQCDIFPLMSIFNVNSVMIPALFKLFHALRSSLKRRDVMTH